MAPNIKLFGRRIFVPGPGESSPEGENPTPVDDGSTKSPISALSSESESADKDAAEEEEKKKKKKTMKKLKKPEKILPCPRCNSSQTKFCYYNNYNVNQPRHFCKSCQRYWTSGGTMRNVPVGAGKRKSKNSASLLRHITISNGNVLSFGHDSIDHRRNQTSGIPWNCPVFVPALYYNQLNLAVAAPIGTFHHIDKKATTEAIEVPQVLRANPAALSRSMLFRESV
ncbi:hypothetical protein M569_14774 [Genlisea aurea]|uniref:Dof-type domain-containing protein n=1 Tax=Genlisea aurea TaxID=192259 RepID=S8BZL6_9LAMI|nr:hypothetical protein M569_14774 [Genlisea aurea]